jgi:hypothetical protein
MLGNDTSIITDCETIYKPHKFGKRLNPNLSFFGKPQKTPLENKVSLKPLELGYGQKLIIPHPFGTLGIRIWPKANNLFPPSWNPRNLGYGQKLIISSPPSWNPRN